MEPKSSGAARTDPDAMITLRVNRPLYEAFRAYQRRRATAQMQPRRAGHLVGGLLLVVAFAALFGALALPARAAAAELPRLLVQRGPDPAIVDDAGREVLLRGVNVNQLGDYFQADPALPPVATLTEADFAQIAHQGFDVVRLVMSWSSFQPTRGSFDRRALDRVRQAVDWAKRYGLYVVLDMHQDSWGKDVATPPGTVCPPGLGPAIGWDGAPSWATYFDGMTTCRAGDTRELSPAVAQAFDNFYLDREGIQGQFAATWGRIARAFASDPTVAGYDLFNEPHPGFAFGPGQSVLLGHVYDRVIDSIRAGERASPGGFTHPVFFEPSVFWSGGSADALPPPGFTEDDQLVFAPHLYAESLTLDQKAGATAVTLEQGFVNAQAAAASYNVPLWSGEWGFFAKPPERNLPKIERYAAAEDRALIGGVYWVWKQACGDPHLGGHPGASDSLNRVDCPSGRPLGQFPGYTRLLGRAVPRFAPGRLVSISSDAATGRFTFRGRDDNPAGSCTLEAWVPGNAAPTVAGDGVSGLRARPVPGGFIVSGCARGAYELRGTAAGAAVAGGGAGAPAGAERRRCRSKRVFTIHIRHPYLDYTRTASVTVDGRRVRVRPGHPHFTARIDLRGKPRRLVVVRIVSRTLSGRLLREVRYYRTCTSSTVPRSSSHIATSQRRLRR